MVEYKKGKENVAADCLSRRGEPEEGSSLVITAVEADWIEQIRDIINSDEFLIELKARWDAGNLDSEVYQLRNGIFFL